MNTISCSLFICRSRLTAFVVKSFGQARPFIYIDDSVMEKATDWMISRQNADGSFPEPGRVIHTNMQVRKNGSCYFIHTIDIISSVRI